MAKPKEKSLEKELLSGAAKWDALGFKIVPLRLSLDEKGKKELEPFWKWSTDPYPGFGKLNWTKANAYGIVLGAMDKGWLCYVDADSDALVKADPFTLLIKSFPELSNTYIEKSPHGFHVFAFIGKSQDVSNINLKDRYGLELHVNGLCLMTPSNYEGGAYSVYNDADIVKSPNLYDQFKAKFVGAKAQGLKRVQKAEGEIRPCMKAALEKGHVEHLMRLAIAAEFKGATGYDDQKIAELFKNQDDFNLEKTLYQIRTADPNKVASCESIEEWGYCLGPEKCKRTSPQHYFGAYTIGDYVFQVKGDMILIYKGTEPVCPVKFDSLLGVLNRKNLAKQLGLEQADLDRLAAKIYAERKSEKSNNVKKEEKEAKVFDEATLSKARDILASPEFFYKLGEVFEKGYVVPKINKPRFVVGEERNKRLIGPLLIGASKLAMTSIIKVLGEPGTAKDTMLRMWLQLLPVKTVERSYMTAASLRYSPDMQNADLLYIPDTPELQGEMGRQLRFMRADDGGLISEYAVRDAETGEMTTKVVTLPIKGLATTSNAVTGDVALESGMWTLTTNPSPELTREVKKEKLKFRAGERPLISDEELNLWQAVFKVLVEEEPQEIPVIPYAEQLVGLLESERSESRRDPDKLCDLIGLVAWMRRFQKEPDKRMEADLIDLYFALQLGLDAITQTISELSPKEQQIFEAIEGIVTCRDVADATKIPYKTCYAYLEKLVDKGYLNQDKEKNRNIYSVLSTETKPKSFLFSLGRNEESPEQLVKVVLATVRNSSTDKPPGEDTYSFVDPLKGYQITVKRNGEQDEVTIDTQRSVYPSHPPYQRRSSEPSKESILEPEKKPNSLLPNENRTENSLESLVKLEDIVETSWDDSFYAKHVCGVCGYEKMTSRKAKTCRGETIWLCEDCYNDYQRQREVH